MMNNRVAVYIAFYNLPITELELEFAVKEFYKMRMKSAKSMARAVKPLLRNSNKSQRIAICA